MLCIADIKREQKEVTNRLPQYNRLRWRRQESYLEERRGQ
jgi:hypothetical protein